MTQQSKHGVLDILFKLSRDELVSLAVTVTQGLLKNKVSTRKEAIETILNYSSDEISILRRKVVTRDVLFEYLHENKVPLSLPITKSELIDKISEYWKLSAKQKSKSIGAQEVDSPTLQDRTPPSVNHSQEETVSNAQGDGRRISTDGGLEIARNKDENIYKMAQEFSQWFYEMLNQNSPIGIEHFYPDASLKLTVCGDGMITNSEVVENNAEAVGAVLFRTKMEHNLFLNPNISEDGVQGQMDPHGLVIILACGTLHVNNFCVGVFEQVFALARDPVADNNWKIKNTQLSLKSKQGILRPPSLCDSELTSNYLSLPTS